MQYSHLLSNDTIVALATPSGIGAIAVIRLSGKKAVEIADGVFVGKNLQEALSHTIHFGKIKNDLFIVDEVLMSIFLAPKSYTMEDVVEISCHGSPYVIEQLLALLIQKGARMAQSGEFTLRAFLNGRFDLSQAEAVADLIASTTENAHHVAMQQMRGGFSNQIKLLRQQLVDFASLIELELDFSEEDVQFAKRNELVELILTIQKLIKDLLHSFKLGNVIKNGVNTVIAGRPNAGKSTLLNCLLNEERAIVSDIPGTTRDTIEEIINIEGVLFRLIDTAGIREATDTIETMGVQKTFEKIKQSAIIIYLFDVASILVEEVKSDIQKLQIENVPIILVGNKMDTTTKKMLQPFQSLENIVFISSKEKENIEELKNKIFLSTIHEKIKTDNPIITNLRHVEALNNAEAAIEDLLNDLKENISTDILALDIKRINQYLGEITGEITTDDLLSNVFSRFCIGK